MEKFKKARVDLEKALRLNKEELLKELFEKFLEHAYEDD